MKKTNVYVVGSGGREAIVAHMLRKQSDIIGDIYVGPGNGGTEEFATPATVVPDFPRCTNFLRFLEKKRSISLSQDQKTISYKVLVKS